MFLSTIRCDTFGIFNYTKFYKRINITYMQIIQQKTITTPEFTKTQDIEHLYIRNKKHINFLLSFKSIFGKGSNIISSSFLLKMYSRLSQTVRCMVSLPIRGQRTRSNAKTSRSRLNKFVFMTMLITRHRRSHFGKMRYISALKKLTKKTSKKKTIKQKSKGPVKRSKDKKKSVWA